MKAWKIVPLLVLLAVIIFISISPNSVKEKSEVRLHIEVPEEYRSLTNPILADEASLIEGKRLYGIYCDTCHGESGASKEGITKDFEVRPTPLSSPENIGRYTDGELFYFITKGVEDSNMMAYELFLTEEERWHIVNYVRILPTKRSVLDRIREFIS